MPRVAVEADQAGGKCMLEGGVTLSQLVMFVHQGEFLEPCPDLWRPLLTDIAKPTSVLGGIVSRPVKAGERLQQLSKIVEREETWSSPDCSVALREILSDLRSVCQPIYALLIHDALKEFEVKKAVYSVLKPIIDRLLQFCSPLPLGTHTH